MTKLIKLDKESSIEVASKIEEYVTPDLIYIPFPPRKEDLKKEKNIKKAQMLYQDVYAPVSGALTKVEKCLIAGNKSVNCLVFSNDFQEKKEKNLATRKKINNLSKEEILASIYNSKIKEKLEKENVHTLLISGIDDEPYIENESFVQREYTKSIVDALDALLNAMPGCKACIALKNTDSKTIVAYQNLLGMYKNIELKLVDDLFLIGKEEFLTKYLSIKDAYVYLKASEVYEIYLNIKKRTPLLEKYITISGNGTQNPRIFKLKIGTKVIELFKYFFKEDLSDCVLYVNGMMQGVSLDINRLIVTKNLEGIVIMKRKKRVSKKCIKCGKCISICPIHSNPLLAYKLGMNVKCIHCGLCSYICPSYIPLHKYLSGEKHE